MLTLVTHTATIDAQSSFIVLTFLLLLLYLVSSSPFYTGDVLVSSQDVC